MKKSLSSVICLTVIALVVTALLAVTNSFTAPVIAAAEKAKANGAKTEVLPSAKDFTDVEVTDALASLGVTSASVADNGGAVIEITTTGFSTGLKLMFGVSADGKITGSVCLASSETLGMEKTYGSSVLNATLDSIDAVDTVSGATLTTTAYKKAAKAALQAAVICSGGSVDLRTPEEIVGDSVNEALGTTGVKVSVQFVVTDIAPFTRLYATSDNSAYALAKGDALAVVKADGTVVSNTTGVADADVKNIATAVAGATLTDVDLNGVNVSDRITSAKRTPSGNYVFTVNAAGWGKNGESEYDPTISGKFISAQISVSADGVILDCITLEQYETDGFGSKCESRDFTDNFIGHNASTVTGIDTIGGVSYTTKGFKVACQYAIEAAKTLKEAGR